MYLIICKKTIYHEADQRSKDCPGHGYPAYTEEVNAVVKKNSEKELVEWIKRNKSTSYEVYEAKQLTVTEKIEFSIS